MYDNIKLEKSLYNITGKSFTQALTELDPDESYKDTELRGLDAFERQLKRFDIKVSGMESDKVEKFFVTSQSAVLFPEYVRRMIKKGLEKVSIADIAFGAISHTDGIDFRGFSISYNGSSNPVAQGGELPAATVVLDSASSEMKKFARILNCSYEAVRKQRLEAFGILLRDLGAALGRDMNSYLVNRLIDGLFTTKIAGENISYADIAKFWSSMKDHDMDVMLCPPAAMAEILALPEMKFCAGDFMTEGRIKTPYGVMVVKCSQVPENMVVGIDSSAAAELVLGSDVVIDQDKLINTQMSEISCHILAGVARFASDAVQVLTTDK